MSHFVEMIRQNHGTRSFGNRENLIAQAKSAGRGIVSLMKCSGKMIFIGQISNEDFDSMMKGIFYAFVCDKCLTTATHYQQS